MGFYKWDESLWPLVVGTARSNPTDADFDQYLSDLEAFLARKQQYALVLDTSYQFSGITARQRQRQAEWLRDRAQVIRSFSVGVGFVVPSAITRGVLTAILWLQPMPPPYTVEADLTGAKLWCLKQLRSSVGLPYALQRLEKALAG